jgi:hypothetical protein
VFRRLECRKAKELVRELRRGDVVPMVLLARKEKGWNFGLTRIRMAAMSEIAGAMFWAARAPEEEEEWIRKGQRDVAVVVEHEVGEEKWRRRLTAVNRELRRSS